MQGIKDTFYLMLRDRVAAGNAGRTVVVRGTVRPGVVVVENELPGAAVEGLSLVNAFCLRWGAVGLDEFGLWRLSCEIRYATDGPGDAGGMNRGRALGAMDAELAAALTAAPPSVAKVLVGAAPGSDGTQVFWGECEFGPAVMQAERMTRTATVEVYGYGE